MGVALRDSPRRVGATYVFEVSNLAESRAVLAAIGLGDAIVIERTADDAHLAEAETELARLATDGTHFILTGKATSVQRVNRALKAAGIVSSRVRIKAYWARGKTGLD
nr:SIP domain-containing protein [Agrobacterium tumefaciens]